MVFIRKELIAKRLETLKRNQQKLKYLKENAALYSLIGHPNMIRRFSFKKYQKQ